MAATLPITICIILAVVLIRTVHMDSFSLSNLPSKYSNNYIEDEIDYSREKNVENNYEYYDFSPPDGELPNDNKVAGPLKSYFERSGQNGRQAISDRSEEFVNNNDGFNHISTNDLGEEDSFSRNKKSQVLCRVQKSIHHHSEEGHDFFPKSYTSYSCHPVASSHIEQGLPSSHDSCFVSGNNCITIEKEQLFLKRRHNTNCWNHFIEAVGAGCKCLSRKYHNQI